MLAPRCVTLLFFARAAAGHSGLRTQRIAHSNRLPGVSIPVISAPQSQSAGAAKAFEIFKQMQNGMQPPPPMEGLSSECEAKLKEEYKERTGMFGEPGSCERKECIFRVEFNQGSGAAAAPEAAGGKTVQIQEGPACFPKECQNSADTEMFVQKFQEAMKKALDTVHKSCQKHYPDEPERCPVQEGYDVHLQMDCSAAGGAQEGAGTSQSGESKISVDNDYVTDAEPLPSDAMLMTPAPVPRGKGGAGEQPGKRNGASALAPMAIAVTAALVSFML